ncbi:hypothetical protein mRhiFer1_008439 [Rhinolophus ferrumequinum]|uniref:Uncharacterized protein n=1 Tax=Rhinolophus ferrumequinum TaxID=59479 RepID=A0A7J7V8F3_RHIFE|nr:hypothetical protein mRhiFer1_008439 [Rhinolophus ferrumequinum]
MMIAKSPLKKENIICLCGFQLHPLSYCTENRIMLGNMEEISRKQEVFTLNAKSATDGTGKLFHPLVLPSTPESDMLTAHLLLPSLGIPGTAGGQRQAHSSPLTKDRERKPQIRALEIDMAADSAILCPGKFNEERETLFIKATWLLLTQRQQDGTEWARNLLGKMPGRENGEKSEEARRLSNSRAGLTPRKEQRRDGRRVCSILHHRAVVRL